MVKLVKKGVNKKVRHVFKFDVTVFNAEVRKLTIIRDEFTLSPKGKTLQTRTPLL